MSRSARSTAAPIPTRVASPNTPRKSALPSGPPGRTCGPLPQGAAQPSRCAATSTVTATAPTETASDPAGRRGPGRPLPRPRTAPRAPATSQLRRRSVVPNSDSRSSRANGRHDSTRRGHPPSAQGDDGVGPSPRDRPGAPRSLHEHGPPRRHEHEPSRRIRDHRQHGCQDRDGGAPPRARPGAERAGPRVAGDAPSTRAGGGSVPGSRIPGSTTSRSTAVIGALRLRAEATRCWS